MMDFYNRYFLLYIDATQEKRDAALQHWIECDARNRADNRPDLWIFSTKMLTTIMMAQQVIDKLSK